jgi:GrpB-like predicted nucleotidyltransferase (UPF0157 family)
VNAFHQIKIELEEVLKDHIISIEHVGSTSVINLAAKPIIDIDIVINNNFEQVKMLLEGLDYIHEGDLGIKGREAFKYKHKAHLMKHHLYVCNHDSLELKRHLMFKDYLNKHPEDAKAYGDLKLSLALKYPYDIEKYIEFKSPFIEEIYQKIDLLNKA